jgi:signal peptidase I
MAPMVKSGDLVMFYRLDRDYSIGDLLLLDFNGETQVRRVIAKEGDVVDIDDRGLKINGSWQQENSIFQETWQYEEGIDFPVTIGPGQLFVLGDARDNATDSRIYGPIDAKNTLGTVVTVIRQRNF